ncbi:MAG: multicopper oxidase domain-containing protein [Anaerolineales bacterium]|nr:multicopper oxidase domain-containing protein [Anaerolineales bacterium]
MSVIKNNKKALGGLFLIGLLVVMISTFAVSSQTRRATAAGLTTMVCTDGPNFNLVATDGYLTTPDGNVLYMWGYADADAGSVYQNPGPTLCVNEGDTVTVTLTNDLPEPVSIVFPGQIGVTSSGGSAGLFTGEAAASGGTVTYSFVASNPGTYIYESGTEPHKQVQMGLYGALVVRPALGANYVYNDTATEFNTEREYLLILHDIDPLLHLTVERGETYDVTTIWDRYWTINGRSFPDTIAPNGVPWLPNQPYGSLVQIEPYDASTNPLPALIRYANAGFENHPFHPHGNNLTMIGRDGRQLQGAEYETFTTTIGSGQTYDAFAIWENVEAWTPGNPVPVQVPGLYNQVFKDDATFFSGSPYLGEQNDLLVGVTSYNECGEFYYPWHSHALNEFQNFDEGFGGLATLWRIDPPGGCQ